MDLSVNNLCFSYGDRTVLRDVSFRAKEGDRIALLGPNGTGKTTLFRCVMQFLPGYGGSVLLDGTDARSLCPRELSERIAYIPQNAVPTFNYTVEDAVLMGVTGSLGLFETPRRQQREKVASTLEMLGIIALARRGFRELSGGEQQLVLLARALVQDAKILIMDEPTASLDFGNQCRVMDSVTRLSESGYTIFFSTHHPEQASFYATRVLALREGKVLIDGDPELLTEEKLSLLYGMPVALRYVNHNGRRIAVCLPEEGSHDSLG